MTKYHYTECGLDNIYLLNGVIITNSEDNDHVFIHYLLELYNLLVDILIYKDFLLDGKEIKYLRTYLNLSPEELAKCIGVEEREVKRWEEDIIEIPHTEDRLLRALLYVCRSDEYDNPLYAFLRDLPQLRKEPKPKRFYKIKLEIDKWKIA